MKTFFILSFFIFSTQLSANELTWVDEQVEAIKPPRTGVSASEISTLKNPFIFLKKNDVEDKKTTTNSTDSLPNGYKISSKTNRSSNSISSKSFKLSAIINGSAFINSKWYKLNEKIKGFTVSEISLSEVVLTKKGKKILLSTKSNILNLKLKSK